MKEIREMFHKMGNWHNKISIVAGLTKMELESKYPSRKPPEIKETLKTLTRMERHAIGASKTLNQLKNIIYGIIDPDTGKPKVK